MSEEKLAPNRNRIEWDECFMRIAKVIALRSKDPNSQVGAVIVTKKNIVVGLGYNGFPRGVDDEQLPWEREGEFCDTKYAYVVHAEENAVYNSNANTDGCILYGTLFPCNECAKTIIQSGIKEVVFESDKYHDTDICRASRKLFDLAGVRYRQYIPTGDVSKGEPIEVKVVESAALKIRKIVDDAIVPSYAHEGDAGLDLYAIDEVEIPAGSRAKISTGIAFEIPDGNVGLIWDRSGLSTKKGLKVIGGVIDSGYRGEVLVGMANISRETAIITKGEKVAQMVIQPVKRMEVEVTSELTQTDRGKNGFGSSDLTKIDPEIDFENIDIPDKDVTEEDYKVLDIEEEKNIEEGQEDESTKSRW